MIPLSVTCRLSRNKKAKKTTANMLGTGNYQGIKDIALDLKNNP